MIVAPSCGEYGIRGFVAAFDAATGDEVWRFNTIPSPGEPGYDTWPAGTDAWEHGGGSAWVTGTVKLGISPVADWSGTLLDQPGISRQVELRAQLPAMSAREQRAPSHACRST